MWEDYAIFRSAVEFFWTKWRTRVSYAHCSIFLFQTTIKFKIVRANFFIRKEISRERILHWRETHERCGRRVDCVCRMADNNINTLWRRRRKYYSCVVRRRAISFGQSGLPLVRRARVNVRPPSPPPPAPPVVRTNWIKIITKYKHLYLFYVYNIVYSMIVRPSKWWRELQLDILNTYTDMLVDHFWKKCH